MTCKACSGDLQPFFSLGRMPLVNAFLAQPDPHEPRYELCLAFCSTCYLVQITDCVPPETLYKNYIYFSSTSSSFLNHCKRSTELFIQRFSLNERSSVVELASNDGAFLSCFKQKGIHVLGIDPAENIASIANQNGIPTLPIFFSAKTASFLVSDHHVRADLLYGANILAHVPQITDFLQGVATVLRPTGTAIFEFPYLEGLFEGKFDTVYHEHVFYFSLLALEGLFSRVGLTIYDVEKTSLQGGSLRIFAAHARVFPITERVASLRTTEHRAGYDSFEKYKDFGQLPRTIKKELAELLSHLKSNGKRVAAYGAPAKGIILLNYLDIARHLDRIVDKAESKQGLYTPGVHMRVEKPETLYASRPDYVLILCWNIADEIMEELAPLKSTGTRFIIPLPTVKIL